MSDLTVADDIVDTALQYAGRGWAVLPTFNKAPPRGFARGVWGATTDPATIIRWFERVYPGAEIGIACGPPVVVDIDTPMPELLALQSTTLSATTPRGSVHLYFEGEGIRNQVFDWGEVRSRGYLVIAPPAAGRRWLNNLPLSPLPEWLAKIDTHNPTVTSSELPRWADAIADHHKSVARWSREETFALIGFWNAADRVLNAEHRMIALNAETYAIGRLWARGWIERSRVVRGMEAVSVHNGLVANRGLDVVRAVILGALCKGAERPYPDLDER